MSIISQQSVFVNSGFGALAAPVIFITTPLDKVGAVKPVTLTLYVGVVVKHCLISTSWNVAAAGAGVGLGVGVQSTIASTTPSALINKAYPLSKFG